ncbi:response regulator [Nodosilinea sp. LEGE 07088]|uniref:response regulator n=1 Tax=Nodosilinea sp. LEGE 07088 TaxID=2777968 RepID=UPI0018805AE2|nr:response regulator [Nodosilinea sp. LEGE 07088]MBE9138998.1 response regulator [Nodosilinea sp. LEGE 07088]
MVLYPSDPADGRVRVVVVEDDNANRLFFADYLTFTGFEVLALPHGLDLEQQLKAFQPQLLLLDLGLPEIDGYTLLKQIRSSPVWRHLPVVVVSGYAFAEDQHRALALGAQRYLVKPVPLQQLTQTVYAVLQLPQSRDCP